MNKRQRNKRHKKYGFIAYLFHREDKFYNHIAGPRKLAKGAMYWPGMTTVVRDMRIPLTLKPGLEFGVHNEA